MKRLMLFTVLTLALAVGSACGTGAQPAPQTSAPPTQAASPTATPPPTATSAPTATATLQYPLTAGTSVPPPKELSASNVNSVTELARWGTGRIFDAAYSPDGKLIAIATPIGVTILESAAFAERLFIETEAAVNSVAFAPDGVSLVTGLADNSIRTWSVADGKELESFEGETKTITRKNAPKEQVSAVGFSDDGELLAAGSSEGYVNVWKTSDASLVRSFKNHELGITKVFFAPDGESVFSASWDGTVRRSQLSDGKLLQAFGGQAVRDAALSKDGTVLATYDQGLYYSNQGNVFLWDVETGKKLMTLKAGDYWVHVTSIALSPDGDYIAAGWKDYSVSVWRTSNGSLLHAFEDLKPKSENYYYVYPTVRFSPDGAELLYAASDSVAKWDARGASLLDNKALFTQATYRIALSPNGSLLASVDGLDVHLREFPTGTLVETKDPMRSIGNVDFSNDGNSIAVGLWDATARMWPATEAGVRQSFSTEVTNEYVAMVAFAPDGKTLALAVHPQVEFRSIEDGSLTKKIYTGLGGSLGDMDFAPDGTLLTLVSGDQTKIVRVEDGKTVKSYKGGNAAAFSPDGTLLAGSDWDKTVRVWKVGTDQVLLTLGDNTDNITALSFSPDGSMLVGGSADGNISAWSIPDGKLLKTWQAHGDQITDLLFTKDGNVLVSSSWDGTIRLWGVTP